MGGGGGKTWSILVDNLFGVHDPRYLSVFFRKTTVELETNLWPSAKEMYEPLIKDAKGKYIGKAHIDDQKKVITFPSGAKSKFAYLQYDKDADAYYGSELCKVYIDELQFHSRYKFDVLFSRNRSMADVTKGMRFTLNPDPEHWMYEWVQPYIMEDGLPDKKLAGKVRYFLIKEGELHTAWSKEELWDIVGKYDEFGEINEPQTYTYIPATVRDNKVLMEKDPGYLRKLKNMPVNKRNRLLLGSWAVDEDSGMYFRRGWLKRATHVPRGSVWVRGWDTAGQVPDPSKNIWPDFTVGVRLARCPDGNYYICGMQRFQERPGPRDERIIATAKSDGDDTTLVLPVDPGATGKQIFDLFSARCIQEGVKLGKDPIPYTKSKRAKYEPFSIACENGSVYIVESMFDSHKDLEQFYKENELFTGERSETGKNSSRRDDIPDATATAFNYLAKKKNIRAVPRGQISGSTKAAGLIESNNSRLTPKSAPEYTPNSL